MPLSSVCYGQLCLELCKHLFISTSGVSLLFCPNHILLQCQNCTMHCSDVLCKDSPVIAEACKAEACMAVAFMHKGCTHGIVHSLSSEAHPSVCHVNERQHVACRFCSSSRSTQQRWMSTLCAEVCVPLGGVLSAWKGQQSAASMCCWSSSRPKSTTWCKRPSLSSRTSSGDTPTGQHMSCGFKQSTLFGRLRLRASYQLFNVQVQIRCTWLS